MLLLILLIIHLSLLVNTRFTLWPEMVVYPYLLNNGFLLYKDIINPYPPLLIGFLSVFSKIVGYKVLPFQVLTWLIILVIDISIFFVTQKLFKKSSQAFFSTLFFVILSIPFLINGLWFDLVQTPLIIFAFYFFYQYLSKKKSKQLFFSFFLLTIAFFIKQQILWIIAFFLIIMFIKFGSKTKNILLKNFYILLPFLILLVLQIIFFSSTGLLGDFFYWTLYFPFFKASQIPGYVLLPTIKQLIVIFGLLFFFVPVFLIKKRIRPIILIGTVLTLFAYPRFDYFHLIPSLSILSIASYENLKLFASFKNKAVLISLIGLLILTVFTLKYFSKNWTQEVRFFERDIMTTSLFINKITNSDEPIYIQNGPDQILPLATRLPLKPWADEFPWYLEIPKVQDRIIDGLKVQHPRFILFKPYESGSQYQIGAYRPKKLADYIDQNYQDFVQINHSFWLKIKK